MIARRGGNDPAIVCDDVDIAEVAPKVGFRRYAQRTTRLLTWVTDCWTGFLEFGPGNVVLNCTSVEGPNGFRFVLH